MRSFAQAVLLIAALISAEPSFGQGTFYFTNFEPSIGLDAPLFDGNSNRLEGSSYMVLLYGGATTDSLQPLVPAATFFTGIGAGYFRDGAREVPGVPPGAVAWLQVRAWDARLGTTYEEVVARDIGGYGESGLLFLTSGGNVGGVPTPPRNLDSLQSFSLRPVVPEPGTVFLLAAGLSLLLFRGRYKRG